jgi:hypothetical protein
MPPREVENSDLNPLCTSDPLARQLAALQPLPAGLNRDQLLYAAGAAARDREVVFWKRLCLGQIVAVCALIGVGIAANGWDVAGLNQHKMVAVPVPVPVPQPPAPEPVPIPSGPPPQFAGADTDDLEPFERAKWLRLRADVFAAGLTVLPTPSAPPPRMDATTLEQSLHLPPGVLAAPYTRPKPKPNPEPDEPE